MINLAQLAIDHTRVVIATTLLIVIVGFTTFLSFPAQEDPPIKVREAVVTASFPGMSPERIEDLITKPLERKIREISEVERITSSAYTGGTTISVKLYDKYFDLQSYWQNLRNKMADVRGSLPEGTIGPFVNDSFGSVAVATIAITAEDFTMAEMSAAIRPFRDRLTGLRGVKQIEIHGILPERVYLEGRAAELSQLGLSIGAILDALQKQNIILSGGQIVADGMVVTIAPTGNFEDVQDILKTPIRVPSTMQSVLLGDILTIRRGYQEPRASAAYYNNKKSVVLAISMKDGENVVEFGARLKQAVALGSKVLPAGFEVAFPTFQPDVVSHSVNEVERTLYETLLIVLVVVMLFLGVRTGMIVGSIVPITMLLSLIIMRMMEIDLQRVSIASMIIALGLLVDNGIVIAEDIIRRLSGGEDKRAACINAGKTLAIPLLVSSLTVILAFMPLLLAEDQTGEYVRSLAQVIAITLVSSWILALTITPVMCFYFIKSGGHEGETEENYNTKFYRGYRLVLHKLLRNRISFMTLIFGLFCLSIIGFKIVPQQFFPNSSRNAFMVVINLPAGTGIERTSESMIELNQWLLDRKQNPEVESVMSYLGYGGPRIVLAMAPIQPGSQRAFTLVNVPVNTDVGPIVERVRLHMLKEFPEIAGEVKKFWLGGSETGLIQLRIVGNDADTLKSLSESVKDIMRSVPGTIDVKDDWENRTMKFVVKIDQNRANLAGVSSADIARSLSTALQGAQISAYREGDQVIPIVLRGESDVNLSLDQVRTLYVFSSDGKKSVPLLQVADFIGIPEDGVIRRRNEQRTITVSSKNLVLQASELTKKIRPQLSQLELPPGYQIGIGGELEASGNAQDALLKFLPLCFGAMLLLLLAQFNSFRCVLIIALTIPLCLTGAVLGLLVSKATFGFMAIMGLLSLAGIIVNNAILLISRINEELQDGAKPHEAIISAAVKRLRPIVMTKLTCILGLVPLMIFGGELWFAMTVVIMGGLALGTLLTLGVIPVLYSLLFRIQTPENLVAATPLIFSHKGDPR